MKQWNGLLKKEWLLMKEWVYGFMVSVAIIVVLLTIGLTVVSIDGLTPTAVIGIAVITWVLVVLFLPLTVLLNSFRKEWDRPDIWLHSEGSIFKLFGSKFVFASLVGLLSIVLPILLLLISFAIFGAFANEFTVTELIIFAVTLFYSFYMTALLIAATGLFLAVLYQLIKPAVKGMAIPILVVLFIAGSWLLEKMKATLLYAKITSFGPIGDPSKEEFYVEKEGFFIGPTEPVVYTGDIVISLLTVFVLFVVAAVLFEKKVRL